MEQGAVGVDVTGVISREQLEREQRRSAAGGTLVLEPAPQELELLPVPELSDRPIRERALTEVSAPGRTLDLVLPLRPELGKLALRALLGELRRLLRR